MLVHVQQETKQQTRNRTEQNRTERETERHGTERNEMVAQGDENIARSFTDTE